MLVPEESVIIAPAVAVQWGTMLDNYYQSKRLHRPPRIPVLIDVDGDFAMQVSAVFPNGDKLSLRLDDKLWHPAYEV